MPQPRRHKNNAAKQKAYRERKKAREAAMQHPTSRPHDNPTEEPTRIIQSLAVGGYLRETESVEETIEENVLA